MTGARKSEICQGKFEEKIEEEGEKVDIVRVRGGRPQRGETGGVEWSLDAT